MGFTGTFALFALLVSASALAVTENGKEKEYPERGCGTPSSLDYRGLEKLLASVTMQKTAPTVPDVVAALPETYRSKLTAMVKSRSRQGASERFWRPILYGEDGTFLMAFHGDPDGKSADNIETIQFNAKTNGFEFREYHVPPRPGDGAVNPPKCLGCHGGRSTPRPNWEPYPGWTGAVGENDDGVVPGSATAKMVAGFLASPPPFYAPLAPALRKTFTLTKAFRLANPDIHRFAGSPNISLTNRLTCLNYRRIAGQITAVPGYPKYRHFIAGIVKGCDLPVLLSCLPGSVNELLSPAERRDPALVRYTRDEFDSARPPLPAGFAALKRLNEILKWGIPIDENNWSMTFRMKEMNQGPFTAFNPVNPFEAGFTGVDGRESDFAYLLDLGLATVDPVIGRLLEEVPRDRYGGTENAPACRAIASACQRVRMVRDDRRLPAPPVHY